MKCSKCEFENPDGAKFCVECGSPTEFRCPQCGQITLATGKFCMECKVDELHALARDVYYSCRGRINARELHEQMNSCSCLTLILACFIYWQAREIDPVLNECEPEGNGIDVSLREHVSPIEWENVILYGEYVLNRDLVRRS